MSSCYAALRGGTGARAMTAETRASGEGRGVMEGKSWITAKTRLETISTTPTAGEWWTARCDVVAGTDAVVTFSWAGDRFLRVWRTDARGLPVFRVKAGSR